MRTLRDEWKRLLGDDYICGWPATFFAEYGSYRVVEGELHLGTSGYDEGFVHIHPEGGPFRPASATRIGKPFDIVKLLLPPEEKEGDSLNRKLLQAQSDKRDAQHRADRYEKALREIAVKPEGYAYTGMPHLMAELAKEALDD